MNIPQENFENIILDAGVIFIDYALITERIFAPTKGGSSFEIKREYREIEFDGKRGRTKGGKRLLYEDAFLKCNLMDLSKENLQIALAGARYDEATGAITNATLNSYLPYVSNVTWVGQTMGGVDKVITIYNAMNEDGLKLDFKDKDESSSEITFYAHYNPEDLSEPIYKILDVVPAGIHTVSFTIKIENVVTAGATVLFMGYSKLTDVNGVATFANVAEGVNLPYIVRKSGYNDIMASVTVDGDKAIIASLIAI